MKTFVRYTVLFFLPVVLLAGAAEILIREIPKNYIEKRIYLDTHADSLEVLFLGNSHAMDGINPDFIQKKSFNAAFPSQTYDLDLSILRHYDSEWKKLEYIVLPVSYCSLFEILSQGKEDWRVKNYVLYMGLDVSGKLSDHSEILGNKLWYSLLRLYQHYLLGQSEITCTSLGWDGKQAANPEELAESGKEKARLHTNQDQGVSSLPFLRSILAYAQDRKIKVILYTPPAYRTYTENMNPGQWKETQETVRQLQQEYPDVFYFNFLEDPDFDPEDFYDGDHLSLQGSRKFTLRMNDLLNKMPAK